MPSDSPDRQGRNAFANALPDYWIEDAILEGMAATAGVSVEAIKAELPAIRVAMRNAKIAKNTRKVLADWTPSKVQHRLQGVENQCRRILDGTDKNCRRLLKTLDVSPETAEDGITDAALSRALLMALRDDETEDDLRAAVSDLDLHRLLRWARTARQMLSGEQGLPAGVRTALRGIAPGNSGEEWVDDFIRDLAPIYERLTGKPATAAWNTGGGNKPAAFTAFVIAAERLLPDTAVGLRNPARAWQQRIERALPRRPAPENDLRD